MDNPAAPANAPAPAPRTMTPVLMRAFELFKDGAAIEDVMHQIGRSRGLVADYLYDYIRREKPATVKTWIADDVYARVWAAVKVHGDARLWPLFVELDETVPYDDIRIVVAHLGRDKQPE